MTERAATQVDPTNVEQLHVWDGDGGDYWAERADRFDEGIAGYHGQFLAAAAIESGENVLDIGCGSGRTTRDAARRAADGTALGVDLSSSMIELARRKAELDGVTNTAFQQADAQVHPSPRNSSTSPSVGTVRCSSVIRRLHSRISRVPCLLVGVLPC